MLWWQRGHWKLVSVTPTSRCTLDLCTEFDANRWQVAVSSSFLGKTLLLMWSVEPEPVDAGAPPLIQRVLAQALCELGVCWFAGDEDAGELVARVELRRGVASHRTQIFRADEARLLLAAFESGTHAWCMGAQWIVVGSRECAADDRAVSLIRALLERWALPAPWPGEILAVVQAGVDGDAAAVHCCSADVERSLRGILERVAQREAVALRSCDGSTAP